MLSEILLRQRVVRKVSVAEGEVGGSKFCNVAWAETNETLVPRCLRCYDIATLCAGYIRGYFTSANSQERTRLWYPLNSIKGFLDELACSDWSWIRKFCLMTRGKFCKCGSLLQINFFESSKQSEPNLKKGVQVYLHFFIISFSGLGWIFLFFCQTDFDWKYFCQ